MQDQRLRGVSFEGRYAWQNRMLRDLRREVGSSHGRPTRRHIQVKSEPNVHWVKKLRREFRHDRLLFKDDREHLVLELCVRSEELATTLNGNKKGHRLGFVTVSAVDISWLLEFPSDEVFDLLRPLVWSSASDRYLEDMWYQLTGVWAFRLRRSGTLFFVT